MISKKDKFMKELIEKYGICGIFSDCVPKLTLWQKIVKFIRNKIFRKKDWLDYMLYEKRSQSNKKTISFEPIGKVIKDNGDGTVKAEIHF